MQLVEAVCPHMHPSLLSTVSTWVAAVFGLVAHPHSAIRGKAATCLATCVAWTPGTVALLQMFITTVVPMLKDEEVRFLQDQKPFMRESILNGFGAATL